MQRLLKECDGAAAAGVSTIEHGDAGDADVFELMIQNNVALCPTLAAAESIARYRGWNKQVDEVPERILQKKLSFQLAMDMGVTLLMGGDAGVFPHGDNAYEMELMAEYGMAPELVLKSATSVNADYLGLTDETGRIRAGLKADIVGLMANPLENISAVREIGFVMHKGVVIK